MQATVRWVVAAWLLYTAAVCAQEGVANKADEAALLALRASITNWPAFAAANSLQGWDASMHMCQWSGVACTPAGRVQSVSLPCEQCAVGAQGSLPAALANLTTATTLNLQGNAFTSSLPPQWGGTRAMQAMQSLYLNDNRLNGSIPDSWGTPGSFPQLSLLRVDNNSLSGSLPAVWGESKGGSQSLPSLLVLRVSMNRVSGALPEAWASAGAFPRLQILALQNNSLTGAVPSSWQRPGAMQYLQELYLQYNRLSGQLPGSWGNPGSWPALRFLYADGNPLSGSLPPSWGGNGSFPSLKVLGLNNTQLIGTLPSQWGDGGGFPDADAFYFEHNNLSGTLPASWAALTSLRRLVLRPGNPSLCGPVPAGLPFAICTETDASCLRDQPTLMDGQCAAAAAGNSTQPSPPAAAAPESSGGGGVSAVAIAVPVAVGVTVLAALAVWLVARRRRRLRKEEQLAKAAQVRGLHATEHPFDTEEGREALTSPFAAGAFGTSPYRIQTAIPRTSPSRSSSVEGAGGRIQTSRQGSASPGRQGRRPHDSAAASSVSGGSSVRSMIANKCARIETKSIGLGTSTTTTQAATGAGGSSSESTAAGATGTAVGSALELQPMAGAAAGEGMSHSEAEEEMVGAMLAGQQGSSDQPSSEEAVPPGLYPQLPFSDWEISPADIQIMKRSDGSDWSLGSGGFGKVYKALRHGVQPVAVKVLAMEGEMRKVALNDFRQEVAILKACRDVNIVQFVGACLSPDQTMLVTEYMEGGNLANNITAGRVSWYRRGKRIALDVARGLVFLHSRRIVHFDLKSPNILMAKDGTAKIGDVGMARIIARDYVTGVVGTLAWSAPEMLWGERCTEKADIYSYGIVLWEICSGEKPLRGQLRDLNVPQECPSGVRDIILECLETRPSRRPTALELVQRLQAEAGNPPAGMPSSSRATSYRSQPPAGNEQTPATPASLAVATGAARQGAPAATGTADVGQSPRSPKSGTASGGSAASAPAGSPAAAAAAAAPRVGGAGGDAGSVAHLGPLGGRSYSAGLPPPVRGTAPSRLWEGQPGSSQAAAAAAAAAEQQRGAQNL